MKHTPGPWAFYAPSEQDAIKSNAQLYIPRRVFRIAGGVKTGGRYVGLLVKSHPNEADPTEADARLIAAAPDLLRALQMLADVDFGACEWRGEAEKAAIQARAAIAKATGGTA